MTTFCLKSHSFISWSEFFFQHGLPVLHVTLAFWVIKCTSFMGFCNNCVCMEFSSWMFWHKIIRLFIVFRWFRSMPMCFCFSYIFLSPKDHLGVAKIVWHLEPLVWNEQGWFQKLCHRTKNLKCLFSFCLSPPKWEQSSKVGPCNYTVYYIGITYYIGQFI